MNEARNEFLNELRYNKSETSQKEVVEEAIRKQLFSKLLELHLKNGESANFNEIVEQIANNLGLQKNKIKVAQYVIKVLQSGNYQFDIDDNGNIRASYSRLYQLQEQSTEKIYKTLEKQSLEK